jgi:hypothetical protein
MGPSLAAIKLSAYSEEKCGRMIQFNEEIQSSGLQAVSPWVSRYYVGYRINKYLVGVRLGTKGFWAVTKSSALRAPPCGTNSDQVLERTGQSEMFYLSAMKRK